jgi:hypothetical protein
MSMRNERFPDSAGDARDSIDVLIDAAARQMVAGEPAVSLAAAVRQRVERGRSRWLLLPALAGGVAVVAIAAVLIGPVLFRPGEPLRGRNDARPTDERAAAPVQPLIVESVARSVWPAEALDERSRQAEGEERRVDHDPVHLARRLADDVAAQAELAQVEEPPIPPITIEPIATVQIAVESSGVMPIEIEPLQIEPLRGVE